MVNLEVGKADTAASDGLLSFIATMAGHLAWPLVIVLFILVFRKSTLPP